MNADFDPYNNEKNIKYWKGVKLINSVNPNKKEVSDWIYTKDQVFGGETDIDMHTTDRILKI